MDTLPDRANLDHLRKQAKDLLRLLRAGDPAALAHFARFLPAVSGRTKAEIAELGLRLHDAQSCVARQYGFPSWSELSLHVDARTLARGDRATTIRRWLALAYGGDVTGSLASGRPDVAARMLRDMPSLTDDVWVACAAGNLDGVSRAIKEDPSWVSREGGPFRLPPLVAVTHSRLGTLPEMREGLRACAARLLRAGADPNGRIFNRFPPASIATPDEHGPLSALYGAAGVSRDPVLTGLLLDAGADPNDGESLYHSLENPDGTRVLLQSGALVDGTNALGRSLDMPDAAALELLLANGGDPNEPIRGPIGRSWGSLLLRAIGIRCSSRHVAALLKAGADAGVRTPGGIGAYRLAMQAGLTEVAEMLRAAGAAEELTQDEAFVAACARADVAEARRVQVRRPDLPGSLPADRLRLLPDAVAWGSPTAAQAMVELGWPIAVRGGDWDATALNLAVFRGDEDLVAFLLAHGASWREEHGYGSDVLGTLSWVSVNEPTGVKDPDWSGCARALMAHGLPGTERDPADPDKVLIDGRSFSFSDDVAEVLTARDHPVDALVKAQASTTAGSSTGANDAAVRRASGGAPAS